MAKANQKLKQLYLMKVLLENTDEAHSMTMSDMVSALKAYGVTAERKVGKHIYIESAQEILNWQS